MKKVYVKGVIVNDDEAWIYDYFDITNTSPKAVAKAIESAAGEELEVEINSGGGSVFAGSEIYTALKSYTGNVTSKIVGIAASAASVIAMAGKTVKMSPTAQLMIHNVSATSSGDYRDMEHTAEILKGANETVANAYRIKTGKAQEELLDLMDKETWFTAARAKELGLVDEILFEESPQLVAAVSMSGMLPPEVIQTMRNSKIKPQESPNDEAVFLMKSKMKYLKLKGVVND